MFLVDEETYEGVLIPKVNEQIYVSKLISHDFLNVMEDLFISLSMLGYSIRVHEDSNRVIRYGIYGNKTTYVVAFYLTIRRIIDFVCIIADCEDWESRVSVLVDSKQVDCIGDSFYQSKTHKSKVDLIKELKNHCIEISK